MVTIMRVLLLVLLVGLSILVVPYTNPTSTHQVDNSNEQPTKQTTIAANAAGMFL